MKNPFRKPRSLKAVLTTRIEFSREDQERYGTLSPGKTYRLNDRERAVSYAQIRDSIASMIETEVRSRLNDLVDIPIASIRVNNEYSGSIELMLTIVFGAFALVSDYKTFYDNVRLAKNALVRYLRTRLLHQYNIEFEVNADIEYPTMSSHDPFEHFMMHREYSYSPMISNRGSGRGGFFYYLLVSNVILFALLLLMVSRIVIEKFGW